MYICLKFLPSIEFDRRVYKYFKPSSTFGIILLLLKKIYLEIKQFISRKTFFQKIIEIIMKKFIKIN